MPPADQADPRSAAPGAICPPVPDLPGGQANVSGFAEVDGIPGESAAVGHKDEIDIVTLHWCVTNQTGTGGGGGGAGKAVFDGVVIGKHTDLATVPLVEAAATGQHIERVVITLERRAKPAFPFLVVELEEVVVTRVSSSWSGGLPDEEVAFGFGKVCWEYRRSPTASPVRFCFDLRTSSPS
jgi:type VI secretion system secreted protein Hcp